jgi:calcineurin-like phosphoesterase family protein
MTEFIVIMEGVGMVWIIADTHFGHKSIIDYENRPYDNEVSPYASMISYWNDSVSDDDKIFVLGDFSFASPERTKEILAQLSGYKVLVMGNHDREHSASWWMEAGFNEVSPYPIIVDEYYILSHEPVYVCSNMPYANIFGHVHGNPSYKDCSAQSFCASVERMDLLYKPIAFEEIKRKIADIARVYAFH